MAIGANGIGAVYIGGSYLIDDTVIATATDFLESRYQELAQPWPILELYEVESSTGNFLRFVDFGDFEASATPGQVTFNGQEYTSIKLKRSPFEESTDGSLPEFTVTINDPLYTAVTFLKDNDGLSGATVKRWVTVYDKIDDVAFAKSKTFRVKEVSTVQGPNRVAIRLGPPNALEKAFPGLVYDRHRCWNNFERRHTHAGFLNRCNYPSDEMERQSEQFLDTAAAAEEAKLHGWFVQNGNLTVSVFKMGFLDTGVTTDDRSTHLDASVTTIQWKDGTRAGPYVYKKIGAVTGEETDIDVTCRLLVDAVTAKLEYHVGLLIQDADSAGDWLFWGWAKNSGGTLKHRARSTVAGTSTDTDHTVDDGPSGFSENELRIARTGTSWALYTRFGDETKRTNVSTESWRLRRTETQTLTGAINVGFVWASDNTSAANLVVNCFYLRFAKGGLSTCDRSLANCTTRKNTVQFNAFLGLPDDVRGL